MKFFRMVAPALLLTGIVGLGLAPRRGLAQDATATLNTTATLNVGGYTILRLRGAAGGYTPEQRVSILLARITPLLGVPVIKPSDVVVYLPDPKSRVNRAPVIYALGRRLVTVDPATVTAAGGGNALQLATQWAKRLQQVLPRVNYRPSNLPEPTVPENPPLTVTSDFSKVGGGDGWVTLRGKTVMRLRGPQPGGLTATERADLLIGRLKRVANDPAASAPDAVQTAALPDGTASLSLAGARLITVTSADAKAAGFPSPDTLAAAWGKNLRAALPASLTPATDAPATDTPKDPATLLPPGILTPDDAPAPQVAP